MIIGKNINKIITDCRTLRAFKNKGFIKDYDLQFKYVDSYDYYNSNKNIDYFKYKNNTYEIKYFDGCFYPFVIKLNK